MSNLYNIIQSLQQAQGSNAKLSLLQEHKDNELLKSYMKAVYDVSLNYYQKAIPKRAEWDTSGTHGLNELWIAELIDQLCNRKVTGNAAKTYLGWFDHVMNTESRELLKLIIDRSIGSGVGDSIVLKVWPGLYFIPPYMRSSLFNAKILAHFESLDEFIVQKKADGTFVYVVDDVEPFSCSRNGSYYPQWLTDLLLEGALGHSQVFVGELLVYQNGYELPRQSSNGICNSILKGAEREDYAQYDFGMEAWDLLLVEDFKAGICKIPYEQRFQALKDNVLHCAGICWIDSQVVNSVAQAKAITSRYQQKGGEGSIYKTKDHIWKDGTSQFNVKDKVVFEADYVITGVYEGEGKYKGMLGGFNIASSDGKIANGVGSGFNDSQRKEFWEQREELVGAITTVAANDIIQPRNSEGYSLFLPIFGMIRLDKSVADDYNRCLAQLNSAKGIV